VKTLLYLYLLLFSISVLSEEMYNYKDFQARMRKAQNDKNYEDGLLKTDDFVSIFDEKPKPTVVLPDTKAVEDSNAEAMRDQNFITKDQKINNLNESQAADPNEGKTDKTKKETTVNDLSTKKTGKVTNKKSKAKSKNTDPSQYYVFDDKPISVSLGGSGFKSKLILFGIDIGSKIKVELKSTATNAQDAFIIVYTTEDYQGTKKTLPAGTKFFGRSSARKGSSQLYVRFGKGITPQHKQFTCSASFQDVTTKTGFAGAVTSDGDMIARASASGGTALALGATSLLDSGLGASAAKTALNSMINEKSKSTKDELGRDSYIVTANPQTGYLFIEETF